MSSDARRLSPAASQHRETPELSDVLLGRSQSPWTLSNFAHYLEQNYCSETIHFTTDVVAYRRAFELIAARNDASSQSDAAAALSTRWQILLNKYIRPDAEEEINIPGAARDELLRHRGPPHPSALQPAYDMMVELMGGVFLQFLDSFIPCRYSVQLCVDDSDSGMSSPVTEAEPEPEPEPLPFFRRAHGDWSASRVYRKIQYYRRISSKHDVEAKTGRECNDILDRKESAGRKSSERKNSMDPRGSTERRDSYGLHFLGRW